MSDNNGGLASEKTLRDEFAGQAMLAITISALSENTRTGYSIADQRFLECLSIDAYAHADAMLAEKARREATGKDGLQVPDHSPDAGKMGETEDDNRNAVEALQRFIEDALGFSTTEAFKLASAAVAKNQTHKKEAGHE